MVQPSEGPHWGTILEAAKLLACSDDTIRRRISDGTIVAKRFGPKLIRVDLNSLDSSGRTLQYVDIAGGDVNGNHHR
jgi:excisionase family DNA binding protein